MSFLYKPLALRIQVLGVSRLFGSIENIHGEDLKIIENTHYCEDLHYHAPSNRLFAASEENKEHRWKWFPPMDIFKDPSALGYGTIIVVDPQTFQSTRLTLTDFKLPFNTHGIDVWSPPDDPRSIFIFAVNHLPNPSYTKSSPKSIPKARSQIEVFHHTIGSTEAKHLRSIWHPLIRTPNDIYAINSTSFYVTNDHKYRGGAMKLIEDLGYSWTAWSDTVHISITDLDATVDTEGIEVTIAIKGIHNNNGLGRGKHEEEVLIADASAGKLVLATQDVYPSLKLVEEIQLPCTIDNPSYFSDPYAQETGRDSSGYILAGLAQAAQWPNGKDPVMVWLVQPDVEGGVKKGKRKWKQILIFQDDGHVIRSAATAVMIAIDPKANGEKKQAWLFITGPVAHGIVATRVDL